MENEFRKTLALNIKIERIKRHLTQEQLAEMSEISTKYITKIENGKVTPSSFLLYKIAQCLNVPLDKLIKKDIT